MTATLDRYFLDPETYDAYPVEHLIDVHGNGRADSERLAKLAALWTPPRSQVQIDFAAGMEAEAIVKKLPGLAYTIWSEGRLEGNDRSGTLAHLCHLLAEAGIEPADAYKVIHSADLRWGKFAARGDSGVEILQRLVADTYAGHGNINEG